MLLVLLGVAGLGLGTGSKHTDRLSYQRLTLPLRPGYQRRQHHHTANRRSIRSLSASVAAFAALMTMLGLCVAFDVEGQAALEKRCRHVMFLNSLRG
jgi:hypothetical protein